MSAANTLSNIANLLPTLTSFASASGVPVLANIATVASEVQAIVAAFQAATQAQQELAGIHDPAELEAAVEAILAADIALNKAAHAG